MAASMACRLDETAAEVAAVRPYAAALRSAFDDLAKLGAGTLPGHAVTAQRIHGDLPPRPGAAPKDGRGVGPDRLRGRARPAQLAERTQGRHRRRIAGRRRHAALLRLRRPPQRQRPLGGQAPGRLLHQVRVRLRHRPARTAGADTGLRNGQGVYEARYEANTGRLAAHPAVGTGQAGHRRAPMNPPTPSAGRPRPPCPYRPRRPRP